MRAWMASFFTVGATVASLGLVGCQSGAPGSGTDMSVPSPTRTALEAMDPDARAVAERVVGFVGGAEALDQVETMEVRFEGGSDRVAIVFHFAWSRSGSGWTDMRLGPEGSKMGKQGTRWWQGIEGQPTELYEFDPDVEYGVDENVDQITDSTAFVLSILNPTLSHLDDRSPLVSKGDGSFKGRPTTVLSIAELPGPSKPGRDHFHYDAGTGQPVGVTQGPSSEPLNIALSDWREIDGGGGLKLFHRVTVDGFWLGSEVIELELTLVRINALDESDFEPPADAILQTDG